jgi:O-antigen ligase
MPPTLALLLSLAFTLYLFWRDSRHEPRPSAAVWIPCIWLMILGSRAVSQWLDPGATFQSADDLLEGSPLDRLVYLGLIVAGWLVLWKRRISWREFFRNNVWLTVFLLYCGASVLWSDFPFVALKRWGKGLGDPLMVLVLLTDREPTQAVETVIRRCAYLLIPLSVVFIKYYPHLGRIHSEWTGAAFYSGVTTNKNMLGYLLLVFGLFFLCVVFGKGALHRQASSRTDIVIAIVFLLMIGWLFRIADSKTPLLGLLAGSLVILGLRLASVRRHFGTSVVAGLLLFAVLQSSFNLTESVVASAGRDTTLTGRTELWESLLSMRVNSWVGAGFESFWLGERLNRLAALYYFRPTQAHNGYIEVYLNLGWIGLCLLGGVLVAAYRTIQKRLILSSDPARGEARSPVLATFGMAYLTAYLLHNVTEGAFKALNFLFVIFLVMAIQHAPKAHARETLERPQIVPAVPTG